MKAIKLVGTILFSVLMTACVMDSGETVGKLGSITTNTTAITKGKTITFSVPELEPIKGEVYEKSVSWTVNGNSFTVKNERYEEGVYYMEYTPTESGELTVSITINVYFARVEGNTPIQQSTTSTATFIVGDADVHGFLWGDSKETVRNAIAATPTEEGNTLQYTGIESGYWKLAGYLLTPVLVDASYRFDDYGLVSVIEKASIVYDQSISSEVRRYTKILYGYTHTYDRLAEEFEMGPMLAIWNEEVDQKYLDAMSTFLEKGYSLSGVDNKEEVYLLVGEALYKGWCNLKAASKMTSSSRTSVIFEAQGDQANGKVNCELDFGYVG